MKYLVLFTHQSWPMHYFQAGVIARSLMNEGHEVFWLNCEKTMYGCHVHWILPHVQAQDICNGCVQRTSWLDEMGIKHESMGNYLDPSDYQEASSIEKVTDLLQLHDMVDGDTPIGRLALSSPASASRSLSIHDPDPSLRKSYPSAVASSLLVNRAVGKFLASKQIDGLITHLGRLVPDQIAQHHALALGIPWYCFETGAIRNTLRLIRNGVHYSYFFYREDWDEYKHHPLTVEESLKTKDYMMLRRVDSKKSGIYTYSPPETTRSELFRQLELRDDNKLVSFFTSSEDENATLGNNPDPLWRPVYASQLDAIREAVGWAATNPDWTMVIRIHPNEAASSNHLGMAGRKSMEAFRDFIDSGDIPSNVRIVWPEEQISSNTLMLNSQIGIVWASTVGMEMATMGKRVIAMDNPVYRHAGFTWNIGIKGTLGNVIQEAMDATEDDMEHRSAIALRWVHHQEFRRSIEFPMIHDHGKMERVSLLFSSPLALNRRNWPSVGKVVDFIAGGQSPYRMHHSAALHDRDSEKLALQILRAASSVDSGATRGHTGTGACAAETIYNRIRFGDFRKSHLQTQIALQATLITSPLNAPWRTDTICRLLDNMKLLNQHEEAAALIEKESVNCMDSHSFYFTVGHVFLDWAHKCPDEAHQMLPVAEAAWRRCLQVGRWVDSDGATKGSEVTDAAHNLALVLEGTGRSGEALQIRRQHQLPAELLLASPA